MYSRQLLSSVNFMSVPEQLYRSWTIDSCSPHQFDVLGSLDAMLLRMCRINQEQDVVDFTSRNDLCYLCAYFHIPAAHVLPVLLLIQV
jgi:hypothetical protein